ncbi:MAG: PTS sugar transporter subunit IIA [Planctomycetes bacterium]|nr:PTS sugar transporter subunit IIA [Planctomycetota bacterium]
MKLSDILSAACIRVPLTASSKEAAIGELVDVLDACGKLENRDEVLHAVLDREATRSTGIGFGLAVPHGKSSACPSLAIALGVPAEPIEFGSSDGEPVELIVLLASPPDKTGPHIQALARISRLMLVEKFRKRLLAAKSADEAFAIIQAHEE